MKISEIITNNNLYPNEIKTYVQPFSDGSQFFWFKTPSFTQFINDVNGKFQQFFRSIRQGKQLESDSIYFKNEKYTQNIFQIRNSNFFNRISNTYLFSRSYDKIIESTDSANTFYLCLTQPNQKTLNDFAKIQGKFLFLYKKQMNQNLCLDEITHLNYQKINGYDLIFNYKNSETNDLFNF